MTPLFVARPRLYLRWQKLYCLYRPTVTTTSTLGSTIVEIILSLQTYEENRLLYTYLRQQKLYCLYRLADRLAKDYRIYDSRNYTVFIDGHFFKKIQAIYDSRNYTVFIDASSCQVSITDLRQQKLYCLYRPPYCSYHVTLYLRQQKLYCLYRHIVQIEKTCYLRQQKLYCLYRRCWLTLADVASTIVEIILSLQT